MRWAAEQRQGFIRDQLESRGYLNRADLCRAFGISTPQASMDIQTFLRTNPYAATYNNSAKRYERREKWMEGTFHCPICMRNTPHQHQMTGRWIGVDFDGTLATDPPGRTDAYQLGEPIPRMVERVKGWIAAGYTVVIFTARAAEYSHTAGYRRDVGKMIKLIYEWTVKHIGTGLRVTNQKDGAMEVLWDDRAVRVVRDTGMPAEFACNAKSEDSKS